ncbi:MAG: hypothetical protein Q8O31_05865, partial [Rhodocyclaceae bacterium]|nr:hypothetical protein [Rhodocyclaceae bacterium]
TLPLKGRELVSSPFKGRELVSSPLKGRELISSPFKGEAGRGMGSVDALSFIMRGGLRDHAS